MSMGPGGIPFTREEALDVSRGARARVDIALEPYRIRAGEELLRANDEGGLVDEIAEAYGVTREEVQTAQSPDSNIEQTAVYELILDLMHWAVYRDLPWSRILQSAAASWADQERALKRILVYEVDD